MKLTVTCIFVSKPHLLLFCSWRSLLSQALCTPRVPGWRWEVNAHAHLPAGGLNNCLSQQHWALGMRPQWHTAFPPHLQISAAAITREKSMCRTMRKEKGVRYFWGSIRRPRQIRGEIADPWPRPAFPGMSQ